MSVAYTKCSIIFGLLLNRRRRRWYARRVKRSFSTRARQSKKQISASYVFFVKLPVRERYSTFRGGCVGENRNYAGERTT